MKTNERCMYQGNCEFKYVMPNIEYFSKKFGCSFDGKCNQTKTNQERINYILDLVGLAKKSVSSR